MSLRRLELHTTVCSRDREWPSVVPSVDGGSPTGVAAMEIVQQLIHFLYLSAAADDLVFKGALAAKLYRAHTPFC